MPDDQMTMEWFVVGFFDLLGQQEELRSLTALPDEKSPEENEAFFQVVRGTVGRVMHFKKGFLEFFNTYNQLDIFEDPAVAGINPGVDKAHYRGNDVKIQQFSDCVIAYASLCDEVYKSPTQGAYAIITAIASNFLGQLASGVPIRGGIDIGLGTEISESNFYGPGLARAYTLESKIAQYPRIVIGDELVQYLDLRAAYEGNDPVGVYNKHIAIISKELICVDDDGYAIIDYLCPQMVEVLENAGKRHIIDRAYNFILEQSNIWKEKKDCKKAFRYTILRNYFEDRLAVTGE